MVSFEIKNSQFLEAYRNKLALDARMTEPPKRCPFSEKVTSTKATYGCLRNEVCCDHGCCITSFRRMAQFWYFWVILLFIFIAFMACMHYYKRLREDRAERLFEQNHRQQRLMAERLLRSHRVLYRRPEEFAINPTERCVRADVHRHQRGALGLRPPVCPNRVHRTNYESLDGSEEEQINDLLLEQLLVSYRNNRTNTYVSGLPPEYSSLEKDPMYTEPPPKYSVACRLLEDSPADLQVSIISTLDNEPRDTNGETPAIPQPEESSAPIEEGVVQSPEVNESEVGSRDNRNMPHEGIEGNETLGSEQGSED